MLSYQQTSLSSTEQPKWYRRFDLLLYVYIAAAVGVSCIQYLKGAKPLYGEGYTHYNNYLIFKYSFLNLLAGNDLYAAHPEQYYDLFKYSPTFALLMAPWALLPDLPGLILWNLVNTLPLYLAFRWYPALPTPQRSLLLWLILIDVMTSLHNSQSNGLMAALFVLAFVAFERERVGWAALCLLLSIYVKLFGVVFIPMFLMYPRKKCFLLSLLGWGAALGLLPLIVVPPSTLPGQYQSWVHLLTSDHAAHYGLSLFGMLHAWFGLEPPTTLLAALGGVIVMAPLVRRFRYADAGFRQRFFASLLIWVIIFNHKAESATFIIAMCGIGIWYFAARRTPVRFGLLLLSLLLISLSPTDLFPAYLRGHVIVPYQLKALPAVLVWVALQFELWRGGASPHTPSRGTLSSAV